MKNDFLILRDEFPADADRVRKFEARKGIRFPEDFHNFLLEYNGGVPVPSEPGGDGLSTYIFPIERFYSIQDIELGVIYNQQEIQLHIEQDISDFEMDVDPGKLIFIAICERGNVHLNCGEKGNGEIYYSNYSGGEGLEKTGIMSFSALLENLSSSDEDWMFDKDDPAYKNWVSDKIFTFEYSFYWDDEVQHQSLERFKEMLAFYGDPNKVHEGRGKNVIQHFINNPYVLKYLLNSGGNIPDNLGRVYNLESLKYLVERGANVEGLINNTNNIEVIRYLIEECGQDINQLHAGVYPLLRFTEVDNVFSNHSRTVQYHLIEDILSLGIPLDLDLQDEKGRTIQKRIDLIKEKYDAIVLKSPYLKRKPSVPQKKDNPFKTQTPPDSTDSLYRRFFRFFKS